MKRISVLLVAAAACAIAFGTAVAFVLFDPPLKWSSGDLPRNIAIDSDGHSSVADGDGGVSEIIAAIGSSWNAAVPGNLTSTSTEPSPPASIGDGISTMHFAVVGTGCSGSCLAVTITPIPPATPTETVNGTAFRLQTDSDIFFNPSTKFYSSSEPDGCRREAHIESVAVHEVGHLLGLDHTPITSATMFASTALCSEAGETIEQDDVDGVNCIYTNGYGCGGCVADSLEVDRTECSSPTRGRNKGDFVVETWIVDNCGSPASGATVTIDVDSPSGPLTCSGDTDGGGRLACALENPPAGTYNSTVTDVVKSGFSWTGAECNDADEPCDCSITL